MTYKNLQSMAHNFAHSFLSDMNYVDGDFVYRNFLAYARRRGDGAPFSVVLLPEGGQVEGDFGARVHKALEAYRGRFAEHCAGHQVDPGAIVRFELRFTPGKGDQLAAAIFVVDDRGREYTQGVAFGD